jgi:predicted amidohydrolase
MSTFGVLVRGGSVVGVTGVARADIGILEGAVAELGEELTGSADLEIDAQGLHAFPGVVDPHVHLNDPGDTHWEGFATGTRPFAAGGGTPSERLVRLHRRVAEQSTVAFGGLGGEDGHPEAGTERDARRRARDEEEIR